MSQSSLKRVLVSDGGHDVQMLISFGVAILFEASPGFRQEKVTNWWGARHKRSQSSLKRVLVSDAVHGFDSAGRLLSQSSLKRVLVSDMIGRDGG